RYITTTSKLSEPEILGKIAPNSPTKWRFPPKRTQVLYGEPRSLKSLYCPKSPISSTTTRMKSGFWLSLGGPCRLNEPYLLKLHSSLPYLSAANCFAS